MALTYKLEQEDGTPADPPLFPHRRTDLEPGDTIPLGDGRILEVIAERWTEDQPALVVRAAGDAPQKSLPAVNRVGQPPIEWLTKLEHQLKVRYVGVTLRLAAPRSAALRIQISHPWLVDELVGYLARMGFSAHESGYAEVTVDDRYGQDGEILAAQLQVYLQIWEATRPGVSAVAGKPGR